MNPDDFPAPKEGLVLTHFLVVSDQDRSRDFYQSLFDGKVVLDRDPVIMKVANSWLILNAGGGPTTAVPKPAACPATPFRVPCNEGGGGTTCAFPNAPCDEAATARCSPTGN